MKLPALLLIATLTLPCSAGEEPEFRPSPLTKGETLPPRRWSGKEAEEKTWKEPFADPLKKLLALGLPDPAGLPYHKIEIPAGNCHDGDSGITVTEGWLLPAADGRERHAIAWNGLVYPLVSEKGPADLAARAKAAVEGKAPAQEWYASGESMDVAASGKSMIRALYLARLGHEAAARAMLPDTMAPDQYLGALSADWLWYLYDRAVCAHMRGDPRLALASLDEMKRAYPSLEKWANAAKEKPAKELKGWTEEQEAFRLECRRRIDAGLSGHFDAKAFVAKKPDVPALIAALDRIAIPQPGQPADVPLWESPVVIELAHRGPDAVEALLRCLESDQRLTQSVHYWRSHHRSRTILGVHEAAVYALQSSLDASFFQLASTGDSLSGRSDDYRKELAGKIRANWEKYGKQTGPGRSYHILLDDAAGIDGWLDAAGALFHPVRYDDETGDPIPPKGPIPGEVLRGKKAPSVSDLLEKRLSGVTKAADDGDDDAMHARMAFLAILLDWEPARGKARIAEQAAKWLKNGVWSSENTGVLVRFLHEVADRAPEVLPVFEEMAWTLSPDKYGDWSHNCGFVTRMMLKHGASMKRPAAELWTDPDSPWCLASASISTLKDVAGYWSEQKLTATPPFPDLLDALLANDTTCGTAGLDPDDPEKWTADLGHQTQTSDVPEDKKFALKPGTKLPIRRKDVIGQALKEPRYAGEKPAEPVLDYYWSLEDRDKWLEKLRTELKSIKPATSGR